MRPSVSISLLALSLTLTLASTSSALTPNERRAFVREGVNHHVGDDGFAAAYGRLPTASNPESARMQAHLASVRERLDAGAPTRPELAARRAELLGFLDEYVARGKTPENLHLPWRSPVFIDDDGRICAVGYLIERTSGRALAETIAAAHRYDLLEDIASAMPAVQAWVEGSGFTLDELASIQPGYVAPAVETYHVWRDEERPADGPVDLQDDEGRTIGTLTKGTMEGEWKRLDAHEHLVGSGTLVHGSGTWQSAYADGARMAEGPLAHDVPHGRWRFFHPNGNLAAEGAFSDGQRHGAWRFFHDDAGHTPIAEGAFSYGRLTGEWRHFDATGTLLATSGSATPAVWGGTGYLLDIVPGADHIHHWVHEGSQDGNLERLDMIFDGIESLYVHPRDGTTFDSGGNELTRERGSWAAKDCHWSRVKKAAAHAGDLVTLHGLVRRTEYGEVKTCGTAKPVAAARARRIDAMLASIERVRAQSPEFVRKLVLGAAEDAEAADLAKILAANMTWYVEWPHVDGRFIQVFKTLPGYRSRSL